MNPTTLNQYVPAGSYQLTSNNISITISANCQLPNGGNNPSTLTYTSEQADNISDISNNGGVLYITPGNGSTPNPTNRYNEYIPAGSYQLTSSNININLGANCQRMDGSYNQSSISFNPSTAISDISNNNGNLQITA